MELLSNRIKNLSESATIAMAQKGRELKAQGKDIISLSLGEPDFNTPDFIKDFAKKAIDDNHTHYTPVPGNQDLRDAISKKFKRDNGLDYTPDQIVVSTGAKQSLANVLLSIVNPGDEVIIPAPFWVSYVELVKLAEGVPVILTSSVEDNYKVSAAAIEKAITPKTKAIMFSTPCNPSGSVFSKEELKAIAEVVSQHKNVMIIADEIYELINFAGGHESIAQFDNIYDQVVTVNGVSKGFAMTGWRIGYIGAPLWLAKACNKMQGQTTSGTCSIAQKAAFAAIDANPEVVKNMQETFLKRRDLVLAGLKQIPGVITNVPEGAFYVFPDVSSFFGKSFNGKTIENSDDLAMYLLEEGLVATVGGDAFGSPECIRISYATSEDLLNKAIDRIGKALGQLS